MRAAWYSKNGAADAVLELGELPDPRPGPGEVRVKLHVSGVNPSDVKSRAGSRPITAGFIVPHSDGAGVIDMVGDGVAQSRRSQRVWVWNGQWRRSMGTAAEYIVLPSAQAVDLPEGTDFEAGACLGIPALTAYHAVEKLGDIHGKTVLIIGAASGVGFYAAQMARLKGARIIATVGSPEKTELMARIGVHHVIRYKDEPVPERVRALMGGRGVDAVIDMDFSTTAPLIPAAVVEPHGVVVSYGSNARGSVPIDFSAWLFRSISLHFFLVYDLLPTERQVAIDGLTRLLTEGSLQHIVGASYPLSEIVQAHQAVEAGRTLGNIVVRVAS